MLTHFIIISTFVCILLLFSFRVTTCLENLKMSENLTVVRGMSGILRKVREVSGKKSCQGKVD